MSDMPEPEREAFIRLDPPGFFIRHPPPPHELDGFITHDEELFQTIHMGAAEVDVEKWQLVVSGLVEQPYALTLEELRHMPSKTITAFHECYGSPLVPPTKALWRIGNVTWTGVPLSTLLARAKPKPEGRFVWSEGLDRGSFAGVEADRYQKDLPIEKAMAEEVLVAYEMNGRPLGRKRGGPVRLVVSGWFGTNSTKWLCKLFVQEGRAPGPFSTNFYNETVVFSDGNEVVRPVWKVQVNSMIVKPGPDSVMEGPNVEVEGWAWSYDGVESVSISSDDGKSWNECEVDARKGYSWQKFRARLELEPGHYTLMARATSIEGTTQPLEKARNHVHRVSIRIT